MSQERENSQETQPEPDWKIGALYHNAWQIIKQHKVLWIWGLAYGVTQSSSNLNSRSSSDSKDFEFIQKLFQNSHNSGSDLSMVLGASTSSLYDTLALIFSAIPFYFYIIAGIELLLIIVISIATSYIYSSWAEAGLLEGIQTAMANGTVTIRESSEKAFHSIKAIAWVRIIPILVLVLAVIVFFIVMALPLLGPLSGLLIFVGVLFFIVAFIMILFSQTWAVRKIVIENVPAKQALREGYHIALKKFWSMLGLSIVNTLLKSGLIIAAVIVFLGPAIGIIISIAGIFTQNPQLGVPLVTVASFFIVAFFVASEAISGILASFVNTVWSLAYKNIKGKYDK
jgi:hypothetical protein